MSATLHPTLFDRQGKPTVDWAEAVQRLSAADERLGALIARVGRFTLQPRPLTNVYASLGTAILRQQVSGKAADAIHARLNGLFGARDFPPASALARSSAEHLRTAGVSGAKARAIIELAQKADQGLVPTPRELHQLSDDQVVEALTIHRGIGRWTVEMLLMFRMGRPDVFPIDDYGVRKGFQLAFRKRALPKPRAMLPRAEAWRPWRTIASWYLWRALEL